MIGNQLRESCIRDLRREKTDETRTTFGHLKMLRETRQRQNQNQYKELQPRCGANLPRGRGKAAFKQFVAEIAMCVRSQDFLLFLGHPA